MALEFPGQDLGACREVTDPDVMYPDPGDRRTIAHAKAICGSCPVQAACASYAFEQREVWGVWGGFTEDERKNTLRGMRSLSA